LEFLFLFLYQALTECGNITKKFETFECEGSCCIKDLQVCKYIGLYIQAWVCSPGVDDNEASPITPVQLKHGETCQPVTRTLPTYSCSDTCCFLSQQCKYQGGYVQEWYCTNL
jgi:hypothetical protein